MAVIKDLSIGKITLSAANDEIAGEFTPAFFRYIGATTIGHKAILEDQAEEHVYFEAEASVVGATVKQDYIGNRTVNGFKLTTLGSGKVEIFLR
jgi:hypothetical protein